MSGGRELFPRTLPVLNQNPEIQNKDLSQYKVSKPGHQRKR